MKQLFLTAAAFGVLASAPAMAEAPHRYVQANIGGVVAGSFEFTENNGGYESTIDQEADGGVFATVAYGQSISPKWTIEAEAIYVDADMELEDSSWNHSAHGGSIRPLARVPDAFTITTYGVLLNAKYEVYRSGKTAAYVGAGVGLGHVEYEVKSWSLSGSVDDNGLMWQLKAGVTRELTANTALDVSYRYLNTPEIGGFNDAAGLHALTAGLSYSF